MYCCPECKGDLDEAIENYYCDSCGCSYEIKSGIPCFSDLSTYHGEVSNALMSTILKDSELLGYREAFKRHIKDPFIFRYVGDDSRALWINIVPHTKESKFLDVGCGWGTNSLPIANEVGQVFALDATLERVQFVQIRCKQDNKENVTPVLGSAISLPFPDNCLDIVAFNGVLEWLGAVDKTKNPVHIQKQALREAFRILKPGGYVYVGIENRFSLRYFMGDKDDHSFMRFTSLMPRKLANMYCRLRTNQPYYTYTHSLNSYKKLLMGEGFTNIQAYYPWPTYRNPTDIVPLEKLSILKHLNTLLIGGQEISFRQRIYLSLLKGVTWTEGEGRFCHSFCFVAQK